jgi:hypothetical protein
VFEREREIDETGWESVEVLKVLNVVKSRMYALGCENA